MFQSGGKGLLALIGYYERRGLSMSSKEIEIVCPCCDTRLTVDVLTRAILKTITAQETDEFGQPKVNLDRWDAAAGKVKGRDHDAGSRLDDALDKEKKRADQLDDLFDRAKRKLDDEPE